MNRRSLPALPRIDLDWLRGLAALAVCLLHSREIGWIGLRAYLRNTPRPGGLDDLLAWAFAPVVWGSAGVAVFFVLSGYVIHIGPALRLRADPRWRLDVAEFYRRRFVRIYSVLVGALVLTALLDAISARHAPQQVHLGDHGAGTLLGNLLALQGSAVRPFGSNGPLWTLAIEIHFYAVYPLLLLARRRVGPLALTVACALLSLASWGLLQGRDIELFTSYQVCWMLGFLVAEWRAAGRSLPRSRCVVGALAGTAVGCLVFFASPYLAMLAWSLACFFGLQLVLARPPWPGRALAALSALGTISYTLYAVHEPIAVCMVSVWRAGQQSPSMGFALATCAVAVVASAVLYGLIERPAVRWLARRTQRHAQRRVASP